MEHEIITAMWIRAGQVYVTLGIGLVANRTDSHGACGRCGKAADERKQQLDIMASDQRDQDEALRKIGQALDRQCVALELPGRRAGRTAAAHRLASHPLAGRGNARPGGSPMQQTKTVKLKTNAAGGVSLAHPAPRPGYHKAARALLW